MARKQNFCSRLYALLSGHMPVLNMSSRAPGSVDFLLILVSLVLTKLGDLLINPKTVLAWLGASAGVPASLIACLVPIRESGSMVPQSAIGSWLRRFPLRRSIWVSGSVAQGLCVVAMALALLILEGQPAGLALVCLLSVFSIARAFCSVTVKDIQGKTVPKGQRGRLSGWASTIAGAATAVITVMFFMGEREPALLLYVTLLMIAAVAWFCAATAFHYVHEPPSAVDNARFSAVAAFSNLHLLWTDPLLRRFVLARCLFLGSALAAPFFTLLAFQQSESAWLFGSIMLASSIASLVSANFWGRLSDRSSKAVILSAGTTASATCLLFGGLNVFLPDLISSAWLYPVGFFVLSIAHAGIRLGRSTYLLDIAEGNQRTDYVSVSNTFVGLVLLPAGAVTALTSMLSSGAVIMLLGTLAAAGVWVARGLPDVSEATKETPIMTASRK